MSEHKTAFLGSGGAFKALCFHYGVMEALEAHGFRRALANSTMTGEENQIASYIGSSAGSIFVTLCVTEGSLQELGERIGLGKRRAKRSDFGTINRLLFRPWKRASGLLTSQPLADSFHQILGARDDFRKLAPELFIVSTQLNSARKVIFGPHDSRENGSYDRFIAYFNDVKISDAIAASVCVPGVFVPYKIYNQSSQQPIEYVDGEIREALSMHVARDHGVTLSIISNTWVSYAYDQDVGTLSDAGIFSIIGQVITQSHEQKIDRLRNEQDRYMALFEVIEDFGKQYQIPNNLMRLLFKRVCATLRFRPIDEIYISPTEKDVVFNCASSWTTDPSALHEFRRVGREAAERALSWWEQSRHLARDFRALFKEE